MSLTPSRGCLLDLPWEDILVPHVLCHLPLQQLLGLQRVSKAFQALVQLYLANMRCFDSSQVRGGSGLGCCGCADVGKPGCKGTGRLLLGSLGWWLVCLTGQMGLGRRGGDSGPSNATTAFSKRSGEE